MYDYYYSEKQDKQNELDHVSKSSSIITKIIYDGLGNRSTTRETIEHKQPLYSTKEINGVEYTMKVKKGTILSNYIFDDFVLVHSDN